MEEDWVRRKKTNEKRINNDERFDLPGELYFDIWVLFWCLVLPFGRNPLHVQHDILCDQSSHPDLINFWLQGRCLLCKCLWKVRGREFCLKEKEKRFNRSSLISLVFSNTWRKRPRSETSKSFFITWLSTNIAISMNMSWSSRIEFSSLMMSACRASMSARVCFACCVSIMI